jgi:Undecaprenyl-phosphate glucose phosphotransferase
MSMTQRAMPAPQEVRIDVARPLEADTARVKSPARIRLLSLLIRSAAIEFLVVACSAYFASLIYYRAVLLQWPPANEYTAAAFFIAVMISVISLVTRSFEGIQTQSQRQFIARGLSAVGIAFLFLLTSMFLFKVAGDYSRGTFFAQLFAVATAVLLFRAALFNRARAAIAEGRVQASSLVVIGDEFHSTTIAAALANEGIQVARIYPFPYRRAAIASGKKDEVDLITARDIVADCRSLLPDDILIVPADVQLTKVSQLTAILSELPSSVHVIPRAAMDVFSSGRLGALGTRTTIQLVRRPLTTFDYAIKRAFDFVTAAGGVVLLAPTLAIIAAAIKIDSAGPVFFRQTRHGYNNEPIGVFKFRTMTVTEDGHSFAQAKKSDPRITRIGRLLRRTNIDELPLGEMSIVGPRPHPIALNEQYESLLAPYMRRHTFKPGITGWAQVNGYRGETDTLEKMQKRLEYDLHYIDNWSFLFDIQIVLLTLISRKAYANAY